MNRTEEAVKLAKIASFLEEYDIKNATINEDLTVDIDGIVNLRGRNLNEIPFQFGKVSRYFDIDFNNLTSLKGCPEYIGGSFYCSENKFETLDGCPRWVGGKFSCCDNNITTLKGCPEYVGDNFYCTNNKLESLKDCPKYIGGSFYCYDNPDLKSLKGIGQVNGVIHSDFFDGYLKDYNGEL